MDGDRVTGLLGLGVLTLFAVFLLVYAVSLVRQHDSQRELVLGVVLLCGMAPAVVGGVILVVLGTIRLA